VSPSIGTILASKWIYSYIIPRPQKGLFFNFRNIKGRVCIKEKKENTKESLGDISGNGKRGCPSRLRGHGKIYLNPLRYSRFQQSIHTIPLCMW